MTNFIRSLALFSLVCLLPLRAQAAPPAPPLSPQSNLVTIILPAAVLQQTLSTLLPLPIEEHGGSQSFQGTISLDSISSLEIGGDQLSVSGQLSGRNLSMNAQVGGQDLQIRLGSVAMPVTCDIALRFDPKKQVLFLLPRFAQTGEANPNDMVVPLLNSLSREYPVQLDRLEPLSWMMGEKRASLRLEAADIRAAGGALFLKLRPAAGKRPAPPAHAAKKRQP